MNIELAWMIVLLAAVMVCAFLICVLAGEVSGLTEMCAIGALAMLIVVTAWAIITLIFNA